MKKLFLLFATAGLLLASCSSEDDNLAPTGTLAPPEWLIGTWGPGGLFADVVVTSDDVTPTGAWSFRDLAELANAFAQIAGGSVRVREIRKTDSEYVIGMETRERTGPARTQEHFRFRIGDGTYIEFAEYDDDARRWGEWRRMNKRDI